MCDTFELHYLNQHVSHFRHFLFLIAGVSSALLLAKSWLRAKTRPRSDPSFYDIFVPLKVLLSKISDDVIACDLGFAPPPQAKAWLRPC